MPLLFALVVGQAYLAPQQGGPGQLPPQTQAPFGPGSFQPQTPYDFSAMPMVAEPFRLEITPVLDGKIDDEEWDPFTASPTMKSYLQWTPGNVYAAVTGPAGSDLVVSLDLGGDGWLVGDNNVEARVSIASGTPTITVRELDAANVSGPVWKDLPGWALSSYAAATTDGTTVTYELRLSDAGLGVLPEKPGKKAKLNARVDLVPTGGPAGPSFQPRVLAPVEFVEYRSDAFPAGIKFSPENNDKTTMPGESESIRLNFISKGQIGIKKINVHSEGAAKDLTNDMTVPFPPADSKGRSFIDYQTKLDPNITFGYHVLKGSLTLSDGTPAVLETSYRVAPAIDLTFAPAFIKGDSRDRSVKVNFLLTSNASKAQEGDIHIGLDPKFRILNGSETQKYRIFDSHGQQGRTFELFIPGNSSGTYAVTFELDSKNKKETITKYLTIGHA